MKKRSRVALIGLLVAVLGGIVWWVGIHRTADAGQGTPFGSLEFSGVSADSGRSTNLIAMGEWSKPVKDEAGYILRGRLLVLDTPRLGSWERPAHGQEYHGNAPVYLELQNLSPRNDQALAVYFDLNDGLECGLKDAHGNPMPLPTWSYMIGTMMPYTLQHWTTVPFGGSLRLRANPSVGTYGVGTNSLVIQFGLTGRWTITAGETNTYYLSGSFSPPTNHPSPLGAHVWSGTLELPRVRIRSPKP